MIVGSPFIIFSLFARPNKNTRWIFISLAGSCILIFFTLQVFFFATMRYLLDLTPTLSLLAVIGFWQSLAFYKNRPIARSILSVVCHQLGYLFNYHKFITAHISDIKDISAFSPDLLINLRQIFP